MSRLLEDDITAIFEKLVSEDVIMYGPHSVINYEVDGYPIEFRICPSLKRKPHTVGAQLDSAFDTNRKWGPGSDLFLPDERLIIAKPNNTHDLALNMFAVDKSQLMMPTSDSFRKQDEPLDCDDFDAMLQVIKDLENFYGIYNCSQAGGCSRSHKHVQFLRGPPFAFDVLVKGWTNGNFSNVPFQYFAHHFEPGFSQLRGTDILDVYTTLLEKARNVLGVNETEVCPHNVIMWRDWLFVIPRRKTFEGANAGGMLGSIWLSEESLVEKWRKIGCAQVLQDLGVPSSSRTCV